LDGDHEPRGGTGLTDAVSSGRPQAYGVLRSAVEGSWEGPAEEMPIEERQSAPWESSMAATCECLAWRGTLDNLERRSAEDELGRSTYAGSPVHTRPALATAHSLLDRGLISEHELRAKMAEVRARFEAR
jgi:hypothetical protein